MGFGFNLFVIFILLPLIAILSFLGVKNQDAKYGKLILIIFTGLLGFVLLVSMIQFFTTKKTVKRTAIYGEYIIDRSKFAGRQADWQYHNFRFEITPAHELIFHRTNGARILYSDTAKVEFLETYRNHRIRIQRDASLHHIIEAEPTLYRQVWSFYYVFRSPEFGNVFFKKGKWKALN